MKTLMCKACRQAVAFFDKIKMPITASMLIPLTDESPFPPRDMELPDVDWVYLRCPYCGSNPFGVPEASDEDLLKINRIEVLTTVGLCVIGDSEYQEKRAILFQKHSMDTLKEANPLKCKVCGKVCKSALGLASHMRAHER